MKRRLCALVLSITMLSTSLSVLAGDAPNPETEAQESALNYTQFLGTRGCRVFMMQRHPARRMNWS